MKARLFVYNPEQAEQPLTVPNLVLRNENGILTICGDFWALPVGGESLETVTVEAVGKAIRIRSSEHPFMYLSPPRELPDEVLMSPTMLEWAQKLVEVVTDLVREGQIADAPAIKVPA